MSERLAALELSARFGRQGCENGFRQRGAVPHRDERERERDRLALASDEVAAVEEAREVAGNVLSASETQGSNRTHELLNRLTLFSAVYLPLSFLVGFWGQNIEHLPFSSATIFGLSMASIPPP